MSEQASSSSSTPQIWSNVRVFRPPSPSSGPSNIPPPAAESELKPTPAELKAAFASHIEQRHGPDAPLMTSAMREREAIRLGIKKREYNESRIRIRFSDRTQLEANLPSNVKIETIYRFLRFHLSEEYSKISFLLYQSPPKIEFPEFTKNPKQIDKTIKELGLIPQALLNIKWEKIEMNSNSFPAPLKKELIENAEHLPTPPSFDTNSKQSENVKQEEGSTKSSNESTKKVPKWLKGLQKK